jgi:hypothetical protein
MDQSVSLEREVKLDAPEGIRLDELGGESRSNRVG